MENKIQLSPKKILNKQFKIDFKGYDATEVDSFLDIIKEDYENFASMLNDSYEEIESLQRQVQSLTIQLQSAKQASYKREDEDVSSNVDLLRRISQLEKEVFKKG